MKPDKIVFIVNPVSGYGQGDKTAYNIKKVFTDLNIKYEMIYTYQSGEAIDIASSYNDAIIYAVGGDGTLNEVLNGLVKTNSYLGIIPSGSGNDFYKSITSDKLILPIDIGLINSRYFLNVVSFGLDAQAGANVNLMKKKHIPLSQLYNASFVYTFFNYEAKPMEISYEEKLLFDKYTVFAICNGNYYGNGFKISPNSKIDDGLFDLCYVGDISKLRTLILFFKLLKANHLTAKNVGVDQTTQLIVKSTELLICNVDGEMIEDDYFDIKLLKRKVKLYNNKKLVNKILDKGK